MRSIAVHNTLKTYNTTTDVRRQRFKLALKEEHEENKLIEVGQVHSH